jgi:hypothetical protein
MSYDKDRRIKLLEDALNMADDEIARLRDILKRMTCRCLFTHLHHVPDCPLPEIDFDTEPEIGYT